MPAHPRDGKDRTGGDAGDGELHFQPEGGVPIGLDSEQKRPVRIQFELHLISG
jgi:hypothetical protein